MDFYRGILTDAARFVFTAQNRCLLSAKETGYVPRKLKAKKRRNPSAI
jgi:hypothetical protein